MSAVLSLLGMLASKAPLPCEAPELIVFVGDIVQAYN